jgi:hypothetical protein
LLYGLITAANSVLSKATLLKLESLIKFMPALRQHRSAFGAGARQAFSVSRKNMNTQIIEDWLADGIELLPPASLEEVRDCEASIRFLFPEDFVTFYTTTCNGFKDWAMDSKLLSLWPLERIRSEYQTGDFIPFSDYIANASQIGYLKSKFGVFKMNDIWFICDSFAEYLEHWKQETIEYL